MLQGVIYVFTISKENSKVPIKIWLKDENALESQCLEQAYNLSEFPFLHKWVALMPDTHAGMGMPIGGIIATKDVIIPNAVGVDIGCGMSFVGTNLSIKGLQIQPIIGDIMRNIPVGFNRHKTVQSSTVLDIAKKELHKYESHKDLLNELETGYFQLGTLGGGNHFIELQEDDKGNLGIMIHSGSRHFGKQICDYFNRKAESLNNATVHNLAHLPTDHQLGKDYVNWMNLALDFAKENREKMMHCVKEVLAKHIKTSFAYDKEINAHHNYASYENHYGKDVWVHRKGAISAKKGELGIIPGAMGSFSYIVEGLGNEESFCSSSHGAGRVYSRKTAVKTFSVEEVMSDLNSQGVTLGKHNKKDVAEESRFAYKNIDEVMANQADLVKPIKKLKTIGVVKG